MADLQIIIPLTGNGSRFKAEGYKRLKPFIKIHGLPMINWVAKMFPGDEKKILFICRDEHIKKHNYILPALKTITSSPKIHRIENWIKKGPANDIIQAAEDIDDNKPVLVSYCDFFALWDYADFKKIISNIKPDGIVPCYTGFHPHLIHSENLYATCETDKNDFLKIIREKHQINEDKTKDYQSPGLYYFKSGKILKKYCMELIKSNLSINNEFYMSLPFNYLLRDKLKVYCPPMIQFFCQWGTPKDLEEYNSWMRCVERIEQS